MCKHLQIFKRKEYSENKSGRKSKTRSKKSTKKQQNTDFWKRLEEKLSVLLCKALDFKKFGKTLSFSIFACKNLGARENPKSLE